MDNKSRVVIFGGYSDKGYTNDILIINILEERYEVPLTTGHPPSARENFSMTIVNDRIFLFGGFHEGGVLNDLHSIDLLSWSWIKVNTNGPTPSARQGMASTRVGRKIFITGGCDNKQTKCFNDTFILDTDSFWWTQLDNSQNKITPRAYFQLIYFRSNIIGFGGCELYKQCFSDIITMNVEDLCPNKCSSKGECKEFIGCVCEPGYITHDCSMDIKCKDDCSKNGICRNSAKCSCFPGWSGVVCNTLISCPRNCTDYSNGVCQLDGKCKCNQNYTGDDCSVNLSQNSSNPLQELTNLRSQIIENELQDLADNSPFLNHPIDVPSCPNNCSGHGNCTVETSTCNCDTNYTSSDCSVYISQVPLQTNITQVKEEEKLVLKHRQSYIIGPEQSLYYETDDCKNSCSNVGVCLNSTCFCKQQYTYLDCSMTYKEYLHQGYKIAEMVSYFIALGVVAIIVTTVILILTRQKNDHTLLVS